MFQEKEIEAYKNTKSPVELKNRVQLSIQRQRARIRKQQTAVLMAAACFAILFSVGGVWDNTSILTIDNTIVSKEEVVLEASGQAQLARALEEEQNVAYLLIPLEIEAKKGAHIQVSQGTLTTLVETDGTSEEVMEMDITESTVIYWSVAGDTSNSPSCTIRTAEKEFIYVVEYNEEKSVFTIKQKK